MAIRNKGIDDPLQLLTTYIYEEERTFISSFYRLVRV